MTEVKEEIKSCYWRLTRHEQFENSSRLGLLNDHDADQHICMCSLNVFFLLFLPLLPLLLLFCFFVFFSKLMYWMPGCSLSAWPQKKKFSSSILFLKFYFTVEFLRIHSSIREADNVWMERKWSWMTITLANQTRGQVERQQLSAWEEATVCGLENV